MHAASILVSQPGLLLILSSCNPEKYWRARSLVGSNPAESLGSLEGYFQFIGELLFQLVLFSWIPMEVRGIFLEKGPNPEILERTLKLKLYVEGRVVGLFFS